MAWAAVDWRRGLLRAWVLVSVLWIIFVAILGFREVSEEWSPGVEQAARINGDNMAALPCENSRGGHAILDVYGRKYCVLPIQNFRQQFPEYRELDYNEVIRRSYQRVGLHFGWEYEHTKTVAAFALLPPAVLLLLGAALWWVVRGFRRA